MIEFYPPAFSPHPLLRSGHLQTLAVVRGSRPQLLSPTQIEVPVSEGDRIVLHEDLPAASISQNATSVLLIHGLAGCHGAPYMVRLAARFLALGMRVYRMDMRGFGAAHELSHNLSHAGRSDDVLAALAALAQRSGSGPIAAVGVSLGGSQLIRAIGRIGAGLDVAGAWMQRLIAAAAVSPPLNLMLCSENMQRRMLRPYNRYFIRSLLSRVPPRVQQRADFQARLAGPIPRTLRELDDRFTAPLSGFADALDYYQACSAHRLIDSLAVPTLILSAQDDPIVPAACFAGCREDRSPRLRLIMPPRGGHVGFINTRRQSWMDEVVTEWVQAALAAGRPTSFPGSAWERTARKAPPPSP